MEAKRMNKKNKLWMAAILSTTLTTTVATVLMTSVGPLWAQASNALTQEPIRLNFVDAEISTVARAMAGILDQQLIVDTKVTGRMTLQSDRLVNADEAMNQFSQALRLRGFALVNNLGVLNVVTEADAKLLTSVVEVDGRRDPASFGVVTRIFHLEYENANALLPLIRPLVSPNNIINVNPGTNSLVITDHADNLFRISELIKRLDTFKPTYTEIVRLRHVVATDVQPMLVQLSTSQTSSVGQGQGNTARQHNESVVADPQTNSLVIQTGTAERMALLKGLLAQLDQETLSPSGNIHVVHLRHANASELAATLRATFAGGAETTPASNSTAAAANRAEPNARPSGFIQAEPATNSIIINAPEPQYRQIRAVLDQLDTRRVQVFVESLIVEVSADKAAEFGIQWQGPIGNTGGTVGVLGTNFGTGSGNILNLAIAAASGNAQALNPGQGFNLGVAPRFNGNYYLGLIARFLETQGEANVLSTPNLLTLDNQEAKIVIGQNVPFVTGQFTNSGGANNTVNPFQTIERRDVGLTLRVKPQVNAEGTVKLEIFQEVSNVRPGSENAPAGIITNKRSIESNVLVEDGGIVVLGGLLQDEFSSNENRVPGMADIPVFGNLFRSEGRSRKKTNLMVFIRPVVIRSAEQGQTLSVNRYDMIRAVQESGQPRESRLLGINESAVLPPVIDVMVPGEPTPNN
jgi:general secretion pathway protein D